MMPMLMKISHSHLCCFVTESRGSKFTEDSMLIEMTNKQHEK